MIAGDLRKACVMEPFVPFSVAPADGRRMPVSSREFIFMPPGNERTCVVAHPDGDFSLIDTLTITSLDSDPTTTRSGPDGCRRRR